VPLKPCPRCNRLIQASESRCPQCAEGAWREREHGVRASGKRTSTWRRVAKEVLERDRRCTRCNYRPARYAVHVDGVAANEEGGLDVERIEGMCQACAASYRRVLARR
jgi:hypothetical protein